MPIQTSLEQEIRYSPRLRRTLGHLRATLIQPKLMRRAGQVRVARTITVLITLAVAALFFAAQACAQSSWQGSAQETRYGKKKMQADETLVTRGRYIVEGVARCGQCHTPRDAAGSPDRSHTLEGASVWLKSAEPTENWPTQAPRLAGNPPGTDEEMVKLLTTGVWKDGRSLRQPMPQFRMTAEDAQAVVAYLKSLNPGAK